MALVNAVNPEPKESQFTMLRFGQESTAGATCDHEDIKHKHKIGHNYEQYEHKSITTQYEHKSAYTT